MANKNKQTAKKYYDHRKKGGRNENKDEVDVEGRKEEAINATRWYVRNESTKQAVERISFNNIVGEFFHVPRVISTQGSGPIVDARVTNPVFATIEVNPALEATSEAIDASSLAKTAINRMSNIEYVQWSAMSGRTSNYTPADISIYTLSVGSILALISHIRRALGLMRYYSGRNMAYPINILNAMGIEVNNLSSEKVLQWVDQLNFSIRLLNSVKFPKNLQYFEKCSSMFDNIYKDSENFCSQDFAFVPYSLWELKEDYSEEGSGLVTVLISGAPDGQRSMNTLLSKLDHMIVSLTTSSTQALIGSDLLNYSIKKGLELGGVPELDYNYVVEPVYSAEACLHFHHVRPIGAPVSEVGHDVAAYATLNNDVITSKGGTGATLFVRYDPFFKYSPGSQIHGIMDIDSENPNLDEIVEARRYIAFIGGPRHAGSGNTEIIGGANCYLTDVYAVNVKIWGLAYDGKFANFYTLNDVNYFDNNTNISAAAYLSVFNHAPIVPYIMADDFIAYFAQVENLGEISTTYMRNVNHLEQLDLFTIQELAQFVSE